MTSSKRTTLHGINVERLAARLRGLDLTAAVLMATPNFTYVTGALLTAQRDIPERLSFALIDMRGRVSVVICSIDEVPFRRESWVHDVETYVEGKTTPIERLVAVIGKQGYAPGRIGIERSLMPVAAHDELVKGARGVTLVDIDEDLAALRAAKTALELERIAEGCIATNLALYEGVSRFRLGETEARLALHVQDALESVGGRTQLINVVSGELTTVPNALARPKVIDRGAMVKVDLTGSFDGYLSDMARVFFAGSADAQQLARYREYVGIYGEILRGVRPGQTAGHIYEGAIRAHESRGMRFDVPHVGHGIGLALHDKPLLNPGNLHVLRKDMALAVEPRYLLAPDERIHLEDVVIPSEDGPTMFSDLGRLEESPVVG